MYNSITVSVNGKLIKVPYFTANADDPFPKYMKLSEEEKKISGKKLVDGGSFMYFDCHVKEQWINIIFHRTDGHAYEDFSGRIQFMINGDKFCQTNEYCDAANMSGDQRLFMCLKYGDFLPTHIDEL